MSLCLLNENTTNGFQETTLTFVTFAVILCGIFVIVSKNPVVSVLFLIGLFLSISIYLMLLGLNFIGLSYLLVYVGAVSILFLFILMLINIRISEIISSSSNSIPLAIIIGSFFLTTIYQALPLNTNPVLNDYKDNVLVSGFSLVKQVMEKYYYEIVEILTGYAHSSTTANTSNGKGFAQQTLDLVSSPTWDTMLAESSHIGTLGNILYTSYPLWILLTSLILLLSMVGAIVITIKY